MTLPYCTHCPCMYQNVTIYNVLHTIDSTVLFLWYKLYHTALSLYVSECHTFQMYTIDSSVFYSYLLPVIVYCTVPAGIEI